MGANVVGFLGANLNILLSYNMSKNVVGIIGCIDEQLLTIICFSLLHFYKYFFIFILFLKTFLSAWLNLIMVVIPENKKCFSVVGCIDGSYIVTNNSPMHISELLTTSIYDYKDYVI